MMRLLLPRKNLARRPSMKIGVISGTFHPDTGGPATYLYHMLPMLQSLGHEIRLITSGEPYPYDYGYPVIRQTRTQSAQRRLLSFVREMSGLIRWADVLFVNGYVLPLPFIRPFYRKRIVAKIVSDFSWEYADRNRLTTLDVIAFQTAKLPFRLALLRFIYRTIVRLTVDDVIVPSDHLARLVSGWGVSPERVQVIHNAIPESNLCGIDRVQLRLELGLPLDKRLLVSIARLTPVKGVDVALRALALLPDDVHFVIVGEGDQKSELERLSPSGRVHFVGRQEHDMALRYLRAADVFVLSSHTEGLSHVLLEALSVETPAVVTQVGGNPEIVTDEVNGLFVPPNDPPALAKAVQHVLDDAELSKRLTENGRIRSNDFSWQTTVNRTEGLLKSGQ
jgi:glycosyltransferase involved in cell wall biosynthesis